MRGSRRCSAWIAPRSTSSARRLNPTSAQDQARPAGLDAGGLRDPRSTSSARRLNPTSAQDQARPAGLDAGGLRSALFCWRLAPGIGFGYSISASSHFRIIDRVIDAIHERLRLCEIVHAPGVELLVRSSLHGARWAVARSRGWSDTPALIFKSATKMHNTF
ncbi:hypothetical protein T492DRAFT_1058479 [Pavlovales sp. CCMP2436]|nr:hypothetical protein T492DRAFT_1058479 [Pavlovales sp. CCMP2436]